MNKNYNKLTNDKGRNIESTQSSLNTPIPIWNEYSHIHDSFIDLLSYNRKSNFGCTNIWEFEYV